MSQILSRRSCRGSCACLWEDEAAREENRAAAGRPSSPASTPSGVCLILGMRSRPTSGPWAASHDLPPTIARVPRCTPR
jgi:hypothetical protein